MLCYYQAMCQGTHRVFKLKFRLALVKVNFVAKCSDVMSCSKRESVCARHLAIAKAVLIDRISIIFSLNPIVGKRVCSASTCVVIIEVGSNNFSWVWRLPTAEEKVVQGPTLV